MSSFKLEATGATLGAFVTEFDIDRIDTREWEELYAAWLFHALLIFPGVNWSPEQQIELARHFGPVEGERFEVSNFKPDGTLRNTPDDVRLDMLRGNFDWHSDQTFSKLHRKAAVFTAEIVPPTGGETGWADMRAAYDNLDSATRTRLEGLTAHHSIRHGQERRGYKILDNAQFSPEAGPGPLRPLVKLQPETGRKSLLIGRHAHSISGMSAAESRTFLEALEAQACQPPRVYFHAWKPGDAVIWDNRCLLHCGRPWDMTGQARRMWHLPIAGDPASELAIG